MECRSGKHSCKLQGNFANLPELGNSSRKEPELQSWAVQAWGSWKCVLIARVAKSVLLLPFCYYFLIN